MSDDRGRLTIDGHVAEVERCGETGLYVGHVPGFPGAHSQAATLEELHDNLNEVIGMLLEIPPSGAKRAGAAR